MIYPWLEPPLTQWHKQLADGRQPQALIIHGNKGIGKSNMAQIIVAEMLCRNPQPKPCGECQSCRVFASGHHPDLISVRPEKNIIKVASVRALVDFFTATAHSAPHKIALIEEADSMNTAAANALLKVLEEPPASGMLILETDRIHHLLPTIRSRCMHLKLHTDESQRETIMSWLHQRHKHISSDQLSQIFSVSHERPLMADAMIENDAVNQLENHLTQWYNYLDNQQSLTVTSQYLEQKVEPQQWPLLQAICMHWVKSDYGQDTQPLQWKHPLYNWLISQTSYVNLILKTCELIDLIMVNFNNQTKTRLMIESMLVQIKQTDSG